MLEELVYSKLCLVTTFAGRGTFYTISAYGDLRSRGFSYKAPIAQILLDNDVWTIMIKPLSEATEDEIRSIV